MTVIAIKAGIIATDSGCFHNNLHIGAVTKIREIPAHLGGGFAVGAGETAKVNAAMSMVAIKGWHARIDGEGISVIWLMSDGSVWAVEEAATYQIEAEFHAEGSGKAVALGAMHAGASAGEAVEAACKIDMSCRPPIQIRSIKP